MAYYPYTYSANAPRFSPVAGTSKEVSFLNRMPGASSIPIWVINVVQQLVKKPSLVSSGAVEIASSLEAIPAKLVIPSPQVISPLVLRLKAKQRGMIQQALDYRKTYGDPVSNLATLLSNIGVDPQRWQEIVDEPYG